MRKKGRAVGIPWALPSAGSAAGRAGLSLDRELTCLSDAGVEILGRQVEGQAWSWEKGVIAVSKPLRLPRGRGARTVTEVPQGWKRLMKEWKSR